MATPASGGPSSKQSALIQRDLLHIQNNPLPFVQDLQQSVEDGCNQLTGTFIGPQGTAYADTKYGFIMRFPEEYPFQMPEFRFTTPIIHPNIDEKTGTACHDELHGKWAPSVTLHQFLTELHQLLANPNHDRPIQVGSA